ncbi:hypothetical protein ACFQE1_06120 [Halobium palmae]|uniref:Uncharacterized protein n=1 Tax=Halobium palmae TaxID=1776492 RepID=A0ABD5RX99_9EURY
MSDRTTTMGASERTKERLNVRGGMGASSDDALHHVLDRFEEHETG